MLLVLSLSLVVSALTPTALAQDATTPQLFIDKTGTVDGGVSVDNSTYAVMVSGRSDGASASAEVTGNITNTTEEQRVVFGAVSEGKNGGGGILDVGGNVTVAPSDESNAAETVRAVLDSANQGSATISIDGNISAVGSKEVTGLDINSGGDATSVASATIEGNVSVVGNAKENGNSRTYAVNAQSSDQAKALAKISGDVIAKANGVGATVATGVNIYAIDQSSSIVEVKGNILSDASVGAYGATVYTKGSVAQLCHYHRERSELCPGSHCRRGGLCTCGTRRRLLVQRRHKHVEFYLEAQH